MLQEPTICATHRTLLYKAFLESGGAATLRTTNYKQFSRSLIVSANLSTRKYLEKYLSIYVMCGGQLPPRLSQHTISEIKDELRVVLRQWNAYVSELPRKQTIISINLILLCCLLRVAGMHLYELHCDELPISEPELRNLKLFQLLMLPEWGVFPCPMRRAQASTLL